MPPRSRRSSIPAPDEAEYERIRPTYADTAAAQWELAQWCREHKLTAQRETHLRRVIELEPNHVEARHALGYSQQPTANGLPRDEIMTQRGYRKYKGANGSCPRKSRPWKTSGTWRPLSRSGFRK